MLFQEKITELRTLITNTLTPLIDNDYVLLELPYYNNVGDLLIWKGEETFLQSIPHKCLMRSSFHKFSFPNITESTIILLQGGGNWGDVWSGNKTPHGFRRQIVQHYPKNKIIVFPQTVYYNNALDFSADAELFGKCKNLTICARDKVSYQLLKSQFTNTILLLPDMAFCIKDDFFSFNQREEKKERILYLKRNDCEFKDLIQAIPIKGKYDTKDWPCMDKNNYSNRFITFILWKYPNFFPKWFINSYFQKIYFHRTINKGIQFVSKYSTIYTTRLHVAILSILLHKKCYIIDNSYGKNKHFYDTWLKDIDDLKLL